MTLEQLKSWTGCDSFLEYYKLLVKRGFADRKFITMQIGTLNSGPSIAFKADNFHTRIGDIKQKAFDEIYPKISWNKTQTMPNYDGDYLCHIVKKEECGTFSKYQKVVRCSLNEWQLSEGERVTHWQYLLPSPERTITLLDA